MLFLLPTFSGAREESGWRQRWELVSDGLQPPPPPPHMAPPPQYCCLETNCLEKLVCVAGKDTQWEMKGRLACTPSPFWKSVQKALRAQVAKAGSSGRRAHTREVGLCTAEVQWGEDGGTGGGGTELEPGCQEDLALGLVVWLPGDGTALPKCLRKTSSLKHPRPWPEHRA